MKLQEVSIENFKSIEDLTIPLMDVDGTPKRLACLIGDNGSGKTTAMQAIALVLSLATRRTRYIDEFDWHGFLPERIASRGPSRIELQVSLSNDEVSLTQELFEKWYNSLSADWRGSHNVVEPSDQTEITLVYEQNRLSSPQGFAAVNQFLGRYYVKALGKAEASLRNHYAKLGDVFWFDQHRNLGSPSARRYGNGHAEGSSENWQAGVEQLRKYLIGWWSYHTSPDKSHGKNYIPELESRFQSVFPDRRFVGTAPRGISGEMGVDDFYFLLQADDAVYDLAEMSSGEQAIFPLIYEFVRLDIGNSVVLIDEIELHLHPPEQQRLLMALPKLGMDCQFLISTHSAYLTDAIADEDEVRLEGGQRCL